MTKLLCKIFLTLNLAISINSFAETSVDKITWLAENYPPYNFFDNSGIPTGLSVNIIDQIQKKTKSIQNIENIKIFPWNQAYQMTLENANYALVSTARTPEREKLFKWVGPIANSKIVALTKKNSGINLKTEEELKNFKVTAVISDVATQLVMQNVPGFNYISVNNLQEGIEKLNSDQADIVIGDYNVLFYLIMKNKFDSSNYHTCFEINTIEYWIAFNLNTNDNLIKQLQTTFDTLDD